MGRLQLALIKLVVNMQAGHGRPTGSALGERAKAKLGLGKFLCSLSHMGLVTVAERWAHTFSQPL